MSLTRRSFVVVFAALPTAQLAAQDTLDQVDPARIEREVREPRTKGSPIRPTIHRAAARPATAIEGEYRINAVILDGLSALALADFADIIEEHSGRVLSGSELAGLSNALAARARDEGYVFATAVIVPQSLQMGVVRVAMDEGAIDEVRLDGDGDPAVAAMLQPLADGRPVTLSRLERQLLLADDLGGVRIRSSRFVRDGARGILEVTARREDATGRVELTNDGSKPVGPLRARIDADFNGLISPFDEVDLTFSTNPVQPDELQFASARYTITFGPDGTELAVYGSYSATRPGAFLADRDIFGRSTRIGARLSHPVLRSRSASLWVEAALEYRELRQERFDALARRDRIPVARLGLFGIRDWDEGRLRGRITVSQGIAALGATPAGDPLATRLDAQPDFTTVSAWAELDQSLGGGLSIALAGRGQISSEPLLIAEDIGLGGPRFLRGYNFSERTGDEGVMGYGEVRYAWRDALGLFRRMQLYGYADGGVVGNLEGGRGSGSLASAGGGVRTDVTRDLDLDIELAIPLTGPRLDSNEETPRLNISVSQSF